MTTPQAKLLAFLRQRGGEMRTGDLSSYHWRSVDPLVHLGFIKILPCGGCFACEANKDHGTRYLCHQARVQIVQTDGATSGARPK